MAKSESEIRMNFRQAREQANKLDTVAGKMKRLANSDMENSMQSLSRSWQGSSAASFIRKETSLKNSILSSANGLQSIANSIRTVAQRVYNAEMEAYRIANTRK